MNAIGKNKKENLLQIKSYKFSVRLIKLARILQKDRNEFILSKQLVRSGTSIGANIEESIGSQTKADFFNKIALAYKECRETNYWLRLARDTDLITELEFNSIFEDLKIIQALLSRSIETMKSKVKK